MESIDLSPLRSALVGLGLSGRSGLLPALFAAQAIYGYLPEPAAAQVAQALQIPLADVHGVIEFYSLLYNHPVGNKVLRMCTDPACALQGGEAALQAALSRLGIQEGDTTPDGEWTVERAPCLGLCNQAPAANLGLGPAAGGSAAAQPTPRSLPLPFFSAESLETPALTAQNQGQDFIGGAPRIVTALCGQGRAASLAEYQAAGGLAAVRRWLGEKRAPRDLIAEIKASGLVGMGGAAFPTGLKWEGAANAAGDEKYVVINADESEPGTFKDRILLEGDPCRVLEGAMLAAYAIGAQKIFCFVRGEYPLVIERVQAAAQELRQAGYFGKFILGTDLSLEFELRSGAGAYICGEETALFEALEGKRGFPRLKPPFPTTHGLFGKPTVINNVETLAKAPFILANGAAAFRSTGTEKSPGTKLFCVSGDVRHPGLYEIPFGKPVRTLLEEYAGGVVGEPQAILFGGAAGAFAGPDSMDVRLSFEDLRAAGLPLGSGVVMVFNKTRRLEDVLASLARFFAHESCGKCYPCQLGTQRQAEILQRAAAGACLPGDRQRLLDVGWTMTDASICGLGQTAAGAVLSALRLWPMLVPDERVER